MDQDINHLLSRLATQFASINYDYLWLRTMLEQAGHSTTPGSTLIVGSSHALNGIAESVWKRAFNCSMHSQDLYYDFLCAHRVLSSAPSSIFSKCIIIIGYYNAYQDLSSSTSARTRTLTNIYYPIFQDAHNWDTPIKIDPWTYWGEVPQEAREICEDAAVKAILQQGTYYSAGHPRGHLFNLEVPWAQLSEDERLKLGFERAQQHNKFFQYKSSFAENKQIFNKFIHLLNAHGVQPIVVVAPFTPEYRRFILPEMKDGLLELIDSVPEDIHYVDFNQAQDLFVPSDFMDTDHLSEYGAEKVSQILAEMFGD